MLYYGFVLGFGYVMNGMIKKNIYDKIRVIMILCNLIYSIFVVSLKTETKHES